MEKERILLKIIYSFGQVFKCMHKFDKSYYAIKQLDLSNSKLKKSIVLKEMFALAALSARGDFDKHIVRYFSAWCEDEKMYIQMELCDNTLLRYLSTHNINEELIKTILKSILKGLSFIHNQDMVHLDIKPDNILVHNNIFKIGDLGFAAVGSSTSFVSEGDSRYMAPELLDEDYNDLTKADIFSLGAMCYELIIRKPLPQTGDEWSAIREGVLNDFNCSKKLEKLIREMMSPSPQKRPSAQELLKDPFFKKNIIKTQSIKRSSSR